MRASSAAAAVSSSFAASLELSRGSFMASMSAVHFAGGGVTLGLSFVGLRGWDLGIGPRSGVCDVDRSGCARKPRGSARAPLGGGVVFVLRLGMGPRGKGSCGGMREWAHRLWSSSVNSGAMTSQSTSAEHDRNTSGRAAIVLATSARSDARVDMGIKVDYLPPSERTHCWATPAL